jgi:2'-5' RNA ligase
MEPLTSDNTGRRTGACHWLQNRYDEMWSSSIGNIRTGKVELDPVLSRGLVDHRRGMTLIARPSAMVRERVGALLRELRRLEPYQYYYTPSDLHITMLSLFTATVAPEPFFARTERYVSAADAALRIAGPILIEFAGLTVSPGAILVQGFIEDEALNDIRDNLRRELRVRGLAKSLDGRYRLETAHMTVVRFRAALRDGTKLAAALERLRSRQFGTTNIRNLSLTKNDWYMTRQVLETVKRYRLLPVA